MKRIAILSDVHGNLEALNAVLKDIETRNIDEIYFLGDAIAKGNHSKECLKIIRETSSVFIKGNWEENLGKEIECFNKDLPKKKRVLWNKSLLNSEEIEFCSKLPYCHEFYMSGLLIRLFHATPTRTDVPVFTLSPLEMKKAQFMPSEYTLSKNLADIVIFGHVHTQFIEHLYNRTLINPGSVGNPNDLIRNDQMDGRKSYATKAQYLILEGEYESHSILDKISFQFIKVNYDSKKELKANHKNPDKEAYALELTEARYYDQESLRKNLLKMGIDMDNF